MGNETLIPLGVLLVAIVSVGVSLAVMIQNAARASRNEINRIQEMILDSAKESRSDMNRIQDRVTSLDGNLRDRIAWIEGFLGAPGRPQDQESVYRWRGLGQTEPEEED